MTSSTLKTYRVWFCMADWYWIDIEAANKMSAISQAQDLHSEHGEEAAKGFVFDINRGGDDGWEAREVLP